MSDECTENSVNKLFLNSGNRYICAYIVAGREINASEIREFLKEKLPDYMIPAYFVQLESMPLTQNGKIDKKSLPEPCRNINSAAKYVAPRNEIEEKMADIWTEILGMERVGICDDLCINMRRIN
jgi:hypothetical protein